MTVTASHIARTIAAQYWPQVQRQTKIAPGTFDFVSAGHGGVVVIIPASDLANDTAAVDVARKHNLVISWAVARSKGKAKVFTSIGANSERWTEWLRDVRDRGLLIDSGEAWVGEEDCDWATIAVASAAYRAGKNKTVFKTDTNPQAWIEKFGNEAYPRGVVERNYPAFLADLDAARAGA